MKPAPPARPGNPERPSDHLAEYCQYMHNAGMPTSITIRDVPDETRNELAARAARSGRSLQEYLRTTLIEVSRKPDIDLLLARIVSRKEATRSSLPAEEIVAHLHADRK